MREGVTRSEAVAQAAAFSPGASVGVFAEALQLYGQGRSTFTYPGRVVGAVYLPGSQIPTGRVWVEIAVVCRHEKSKLRGGVRVWRSVPGKVRRIVCWPWDLNPG